MEASAPTKIRPTTTETHVSRQSTTPQTVTQDGSAPEGDQNTVEQHPSPQQSPPPQAAQPPLPQHVSVPTFFGEIVGTDGQAYMSLRKRVTQAYRWHTYQYWFVATTSNSLLFLQILIAASLTALGAFNDRRARTATIFLGATNTVIAGLLTYFKTRNQPNRSRQFRNDLAKVVDQLDDAEANFRNPNCRDDVVAVVQQIRQSYSEARTDAQTNYPDLWVKGASLSNPVYTPRTSTDPTTGLPPRQPMARVQPVTDSRPVADPMPGQPISDTTIRAV